MYHMPRVSNASEFYLCAIAGPVISSQFRTKQEHLRAIPRAQLNFDCKPYIVHTYTPVISNVPYRDINQLEKDQSLKDYKYLIFIQNILFHPLARDVFVPERSRRIK